MNYGTAAAIPLHYALTNCAQLKRLFRLVRILQDVPCYLRNILHCEKSLLGVGSF